MCVNLRCPCWCWLPAQVPPECLEWSFRKPLVLEELQEACADVICLQECNRYGGLQGSASLLVGTAASSCRWGRLDWTNVCHNPSPRPDAAVPSALLQMSSLKS